MTRAIEKYGTRDTHIKVMPDRTLRYHYAVDGDLSFCFPMYCEVGAPYQPSFDYLIAKHGLRIERGTDRPGPPWCADVLLNEVLP